VRSSSVLLPIISCSLLTLGCDRHAVPPEERRSMTLSSRITAEDGAEINPDILECGVAAEILEELEDEIDQRYNVRRVKHAEPGPGDLLAMQFVRAAGAGGGMISGPKHLALKGFLYRDGVLIGTFVAQRSGLNGFTMGYYKGTCSMVEDLAEELAEDIADWLLRPHMNARIGDQ
jgi:hypothetical protein